MLPLHVYLLGPMRLVAGDEPFTGVRSARLQALVAYLVLHRATPQPRDLLAQQFWPGVPPGRARARLRKLLHDLRDAWPEAARLVAVQRDTIQWQPAAPVIVDVERFTQAASQAATRRALIAAVECYTGDLLPSCYDDWIMPIRERLHQQYLATLDRLVQVLVAEQAYAAAAAYAEQIARQIPLDEAAHARTIALYTQAGDRAAVARLAGSVGPPSHRPPGPVAAAGTRPPSVPGRAAEWTRLEAAWQGTAIGGPHLVLLAGDPGMGKTYLARAFSAHLAARGVQIVEGGSVPGGAPFRDHGVDPESQLLLLDDLHAASPALLGWVSSVLHRARRLLVIGTLRPVAGGANPALDTLCAALRRSGQITEITLGPLDDDTVAALAVAARGRPLEAGELLALRAAAEGNPRLVRELTTAPAGDPARWPAGVRQLAAEQLAPLSAGARVVLAGAAGLDRVFGYEDLLQALNLEEGAIVDALDELWRARHLEEQSGDRYRFRHAYIRLLLRAEAAPTATEAARRCPACGGTHIRRNGHTAVGKQNYRCAECGRQFLGPPVAPAARRAAPTLLASAAFTPVSDVLWQQIEAVLPPAPTHPRGGRPPMARRAILDAICYVVQTGIPWRVLPRQFGAAATVHGHFRAWQVAGVLERLAQSGLLPIEPRPPGRARAGGG